MSFKLSDIDYLRQHAAEISALDLEMSKKTQLEDVAKLRAQFGEHGRVVAELLKARRSAKLPGRWLMDGESVQQATALPVARYRARLLAEFGVSLVQDVTCSIGTEGAAMHSACISYFGSDLDRVRLEMARYNVPEGHFFQADALTVTSTADVIVADPARRAGGRRITHPDQLLPPLPDLVDAHHGELAVKCAPGLDFNQWEGLVVVSSLAGGVKEACLYTPGLGSGRRAVMISATGEVDVLDGQDFRTEDLPESGEIGSFIIDPDGAVVRAGLVRHYGARHGLHQLDHRIAYLTGESIPAGASGFPFLEKVPLKSLKSVLHARGAGAVEILVRGLDIDPDQLRKKLKLRGDKAMAVVLTRIGTQGVALVCGPRVVSGEENFAI